MGEVKLTEDELLVIAMEEAAEIIKEASKCLRSGPERVPYPESGNTLTNRERLAYELGDLLGVLDALELDAVIIRKARSSKMDRMLLAKRLYPRKR